MPDITVRKFSRCQAPLASVLTQALEAIVVYTINANPLSIKGWVAKVRSEMCQQCACMQTFWGVQSAHCRFSVPGYTQKILAKIWHNFWLKTVMKSGLEKNILKFNDGLQKFLLTCQANSAFLVRFFFLGSSNSEGHCGILKRLFLDHFSPSFLSQKWCQISVSTRNQYAITVLHTFCSKMARICYF